MATNPTADDGTDVEPPVAADIASESPCVDAVNFTADERGLSINFRVDYHPDDFARVAAELSDMGYDDQTWDVVRIDDDAPDGPYLSHGLVVGPGE